MARFSHVIAASIMLLLPFGATAQTGARYAPDAVAKYLAGLPVPATSPLAELTQEPAWLRYAEVVNRDWAALEGRQMAAVRAWARTHMPAHQDTLLYMFSGPDFLYADAFFPNAETYVFSGLEPVGDMPDPMALTPKARGNAVRRIRSSLRSIVKWSFFRTNSMEVDLKVNAYDGTIPILFVFLARTGKTVSSVEFITLSTSGEVVPRNGPAPSSQPSGVRIGFSGPDGTPKSLYYFQIDLSNGHIERTGFPAFTWKLGKADSFIKSASYLMHRPGFSAVRNIIFAQSETILQDDSGISLGYFERTHWTLTPYGRYVQPIPLFANRYQPSMKALFKANKSEALPFGIGYRWRARESNLLLAQRSTQVALPTQREKAKPVRTAAKRPAAKKPKRKRKKVVKKKAPTLPTVSLKPPPLNTNTLGPH